MKKYLCTLLFLSLLAPIYAIGFEALSSSGYAPYRHQPEQASSLEDVFVFYGIDAASLRFVCEQPALCQWRSDKAALTSEQQSSDEQASVLSHLQANTLYIVQYESQEYACYVIDYQLNPLQYGSLSAVTDAIDIATSLQLNLAYCSDDLSYRGLNGKSYSIEREHRLTYVDAVWAEDDRQYRDEEKEIASSGYISSLVLDAPKQDVSFCLQGDQFLRYWNLPLAETRCDYEAVSIETHAVAKLLKNEEEGLSLTGSAPLEVAFYSYANPATDYCIWYIYTTPGSEEEYLYRNEEDIEYTFYHSGTYTVKLKASNDTCEDSVSFSITVTESSLDCPNFFTPRSTPGENDEFRVAHESLIEFHGRILNRWGNLLFEWTDPDLGWDGTFQGKAVNPGVYFYVITATGSDGIKYVKRGDINLIE